MIWEKLAAAVGAKLRPLFGKYAQLELVDRYRYTSPGELTPERLGSIIDAADHGDIDQLMLVALEIETGNWDIQHSMSTRRNALCGCAWEIRPADEENPDAVELAERLKDDLKYTGMTSDCESFQKLLRSMTSAAIAPFTVAEIIWSPGGGIAGFSPLEGWHFTMRNSLDIRLVTSDHAEGVELEPHKFLIHRLGNTVNPLRDGTIRTLAWLHVFQNYPVKDLLAFVERYGMPFVVGRVGEAAWEKDRDLIRSLIRNFGPSGGGVFSKAVEIELLQAANNTGDVYFRLLEYTGQAITKVLLGQLASSSDSSGLSGGDAQSEVRQDILSADARAIEDTINTQLILPWTLFHGGTPELAPRLAILSDPPEDAAKHAAVVETLYRAGLEADPAEVGKKCGFTLTRREMPAQTPGMGGYNSFAMSADDEKGRMVDQWLGNFAQQLEALSADDDLSEAEFAAKLETLLAAPPIDTDVFAAAVQRELAAGVIAGMRKARRGKHEQND